jgi:acetyl-CoA C-acetyltransferase
MGGKSTDASGDPRGGNRYAPRTMALDPRTPVVVGVGQVTVHPDPDTDPANRPEPLELMVRALRAAAEDVDGAAPGGPAPAGNALIRRADSIRVVVPLGWRSVNPPLLVAQRLGLGTDGAPLPGELMLSAIGGNAPQAMMHDACRAISAGDLDVVMVTGAEAMYTRAASRRDPGKAGLSWASQPVEGTPEPTMFGVDKAGATDLEMSRGVVLPINAYPLFENALRAANGWSLAEHVARIGDLWSRFSQVAATNPYAWIRSPRSPGEISTPSVDNRMVSFPYPKLCTANMQVDQGAGYIVCSVEAARAAGVPEDRWVFPLSGADGNDHWFISHRPELHRSPAIRLAGQAALELAGVGADDLGPIDLYSCFPCVVQMAAGELGLPVDDPARPLTMTGGLTFGGGPGNNYASHGIAQVVGALREAPGTVGMATGLGWYATKHSIGIYASRPPEHMGKEPFAWRDVQPEVDALPQCRVDSEAAGPVRVETYTVAFGREGDPERGILACRTGDDSRAWANITDADTLGALCAEEGIGRRGTLAADGTLTLAG